MPHSAPPVPWLLSSWPDLSFNLLNTAQCGAGGGAAGRQRGARAGNSGGRAVPRPGRGLGARAAAAADRERGGPLTLSSRCRTHHHSHSLTLASSAALHQSQVAGLPCAAMQARRSVRVCITMWREIAERARQAHAIRCFCAQNSPSRAVRPDVLTMLLSRSW